MKELNEHDINIISKITRFPPEVVTDYLDYLIECKKTNKDKSDIHECCNKLHMSLHMGKKLENAVLLLTVWNKTKDFFHLFLSG